MSKTTERAVYRELGIRAVVRKIVRGEPVDKYHGATVKAAQRRLAKVNGLYRELEAAGCEMSHHESDLYVEDTETARRILAKYPTNQGNAKRFVNQVRGGTWIDIPFAYEPWWEKRATR